MIRLVNHFSVFSLILLLVWGSCSNLKEDHKQNIRISNIPLSIQQPKTLVVFDHTDVYGMECFKQTRIALNYAKINYDVQDFAQNTDFSNLDIYATVLVTTEKIWDLNQKTCNQLKNYVEKGRGLGILFRGWNDELASLFGATNRREPQIIEGSQNVRFLADFVPAAAELVLSHTEISNFTISLSPNVRIISQTEKWPVVWLNRFGKGRVIYWNNSLLSQKNNRGFIIRTLTALQSIAVVNIVNAGLFCLDDYPNSSSNQKFDPIKSEFNQTVSEFYVLKWYPDMIKLAEKYGLKFSSALVFNYNGQTNPPYQFYEWLHGELRLGGKPVKSSIWAAQNLNQEITELGLHGYNHQSLLRENWRTKENMVLAMNAGVKRWKVDNLGELPFTYIPPNNLYDSLGVQALREGWPTVKVIASMYFGDFESGGNREFGPEPWNKDFYCIPRNTSGLILSEYDRWSLISLMILNGVWSHFIHPDDVYPTGERYGRELLEDSGIDKLSWYGEPGKNGLYYHQIKMIEFVRKTFPWLRSLKMKEAYDEFQKYDQTKFGFLANNDKIMLETNAVPSYFVVYQQENKKISAVSGGKVVYHQTTEFGSYSVCLATDFKMTLQILE